MFYYGGGGQFGFQTVDVYVVPKAQMSEIRTPFRSISAYVVWISAVPYQTFTV